MKRREMREHIFKLLFMGEFNTVEEMPEQSSLYFETLEELSPQEEEYMRGKYEKVLDRMSKVDLNILRLAVYEMKYDEDVPFKVAINEAVELSKKFGGDESSSFVNGILGKIAKEQ